MIRSYSHDFLCSYFNFSLFISIFMTYILQLRKQIKYEKELKMKIKVNLIIYNVETSKWPFFFFRPIASAAVNQDKQQ